ncbi:unnamed protein product [Protopolystoma xenopodis]|uniref:Uncharacterized protein n=1 Tax=Protopolystoma xenopodis TaxID=117903 RepID=A0A448XPA5_9PLAT|nr:unnamed protein product [Protopolystoma xenopodis]
MRICSQKRQLDLADEEAAVAVATTGASGAIETADGVTGQSSQCSEEEQLFLENGSLGIGCKLFGQMCLSQDEDELAVEETGVEERTCKSVFVSAFFVVFRNLG